MKGSPVRVRASASYRNGQVPAQGTFLLPARMTPPVTGGRRWTQRRVHRGVIRLTAAVSPVSRPRSTARRSVTFSLLPDAPNPVAQTLGAKCLHGGKFLAKFVSARTNLSGSPALTVIGPNGALRRRSASIAVCLGRPPANFERSREVGD